MDDGARFFKGLIIGLAISAVLWVGIVALLKAMF